MAILDVQTQYRELGRIRIGRKNEKGYPQRLSTLRFTSPTRTLIEAAAALYGGTVEPWDSPSGPQFEVITKADAVECVVPPQRIHDAQHYELWGTTGPKTPVELLRRCDGRNQYTGDACVCDPDDRECKPRTHLLVFLPQLPGLGSWRLVTSGFNAARELPAAVDLLARLAEAGAPVRAVFSVRQSRATKGGQVHRFAVPQIDIPMTAAELMDSLPPGVGERVLSLSTGVDGRGTGAPVRGRPDLPPAPAAGALPQDVESPSFPDDVESAGGFGVPQSLSPSQEYWEQAKALSDPATVADAIGIAPTVAGSDTSPAPTPTPDGQGSPEGNGPVREPLAEHLAAIPGDSDTMQTWDAYCRDLFQLMERAGIWRKRNDHGDDSLHAALRVRHNADHLAALKKAQLVAFTKRAHAEATKGTT